MTQQELLSEITNLLIQSSLEVADKSKQKLYDINVISEDVLAPIISIAFGTELENLNKYKANYPGIDLASVEHTTYGAHSSRIAFQMTSNSDISKIKKTLKTYVDNRFYEKFDELYIYNITEKSQDFLKKSIDEVISIVDGKFYFDLSKHVIDRTDLEKKISSLKPIQKIEQIHQLLTDQYVYQKRTLLALDIWESKGKLGFGFSNLIDGIDATSLDTLSQHGLPVKLRDVLALLFGKFSQEFDTNFRSVQDMNDSDHGFNNYVNAAFQQVKNGFEFIRSEVKENVTIPEFTANAFDALDQIRASIDESDYPLLANPTMHPAIVLVKDISVKLLSAADLEEELIDSFLKYFNMYIYTTVVEMFGGNNKYTDHLEKAKDLWFRENETTFLLGQKNSSLGLSEGEELSFQEAFGSWQDVRDYGPKDIHSTDNKSIIELVAKEDKLVPVTQLIEEYFVGKEEYLKNILFMVADFGKGKTSFLKNYAAQLAQNYLKIHDGPFPVYFNLNEYDLYTNSPSLGVIANYLAKVHAIDITDEYFKRKEYIFLIDSLDESGELTENHIDRVIRDILEIQNLDHINQRKNKIVIASRPIDKGLQEQIKKYRPHQIPINPQEPTKNFTENFISFYGFKSGQFDNYIELALKRFLKNSGMISENFSGNSRKMFGLIENGSDIDLHQLLRENILKDIELRKPIFAYMIYKLIISNVDFIDLGKLGVYITFLNQLTKEAKHKDDINHKVNLRDEFVYRNILHASALLWQFRRQTGGQISLTKADICRTIEEKEIDRDDRNVLDQFQDIETIHFLSHSYLGEKENTLHFQHQSFAEILLAEYYLKVFIKYAIEEDTDLEEARTRLTIGMPTDQTIDFFNGMVLLLRECVLNSTDDALTLNKRQLMVPLLASMAINKHNRKLYSTRLRIQWFEKYEEDIFRTNELGTALLDDFPISVKILDKIETLCQKILISKRVYSLTEAQSHTVLFKNELSRTDARMSVIDIDKWLALIVGNSLHNDYYAGKFFNNSIRSSILFDLIKCWNFEYGKVSHWALDLFMGMDVHPEEETLVDLAGYELSDINFSFSKFKKCRIDNSKIRFSNFSHCLFDRLELTTCDIRGTIFDNIEVVERVEPSDFYQEYEFEGSFSLIFSTFNQGLLFPNLLDGKLKGSNLGWVNYGSDVCIIENNAELISSFDCFRGIFQYLFRTKKADPDFIMSCFEFIEPEGVELDNGDGVKLEEKLKLLLEELYHVEMAISYPEK